MRKSITIILMSFVMFMMTGLLVLADGNDTFDTGLQVWPEGAYFDDEISEYDWSVGKRYTPDEIQADPVLQILTNCEGASLTYTWKDENGNVLQDGSDSTYQYGGRKNATIKCSVTDKNNSSVELIFGISVNNIGILYPDPAGYYRAENSCWYKGGTGSTRTLGVNVEDVADISELTYKWFKGSYGKEWDVSDDAVISRNRTITGQFGAEKNSQVVYRCFVSDQYGNSEYLDFLLTAWCDVHTCDEWTTITEATYDAEGLKESICSVCGEKVTQAIPKLKKIDRKTSPAAAVTNTGENIGATVTDSKQTYKILTRSTVSFTKAVNKKSVTVPETIKVNGRTYAVTEISAKAFKGKKIRTVTIGRNVTKIKANAFKGSPAKKLILKTKLLKKKTVKNALKGSKIITAQVKVGKKSVNKKVIKAYNKIFTKKVLGRNVTLK